MSQPLTHEPEETVNYPNPFRLVIRMRLHPAIEVGRIEKNTPQAPNSNQSPE